MVELLLSVIHLAARGLDKSLLFLMKWKELASELL